MRKIYYPPHCHAVAIAALSPLQSGSVHSLMNLYRDGPKVESTEEIMARENRFGDWDDVDDLDDWDAIADRLE